MLLTRPKLPPSIEIHVEIFTIIGKKVATFGLHAIDASYTPRMLQMQADYPNVVALMTRNDTSKFKFFDIKVRNPKNPSYRFKKVSP